VANPARKKPKVTDRQLRTLTEKLVVAEPRRHDAVAARDDAIRRAVAEGRTKAEVAKLCALPCERGRPWWLGCAARG
jgi:hypothetical protein